MTQGAPGGAPDEPVGEHGGGNDGGAQEAAQVRKEGVPEEAPAPGSGGGEGAGAASDDGDVGNLAKIVADTSIQDGGKEKAEGGSLGEGFGGGGGGRGKAEGKSLDVLVSEAGEGGVYDEVEIEDLEFVEADMTFYFPCPCGDKFQITLDELLDGEDIAHCPSCSLLLRIVYDEDTLEALAEKHGL